MAGNHGAQHGGQNGAHVPGTMDVTVQEKTFDGFMRMVTRAVILILCTLIFLALVNA